MDYLASIDEKIFLYLNGLHAPWLDPIMMAITRTVTWLPLFILLTCLIIKDFRQKSWIVLAVLAAVILLADQVTSGLMKPLFERPRPSHEPALRKVIHLVDGYKGGIYGFASSHAADTFGTTFFLWSLLSKKRKWIVFIFLWPILASYSRIYLGVHYPGDILAGGFVGWLVGWLGIRLFRQIERKLWHSDTENIAH